MKNSVSYRKEKIKGYLKKMWYLSTRDEKIRKTPSEAILNGIADDGGLYMPEFIPQLTQDEIIRLTEEGKTVNPMEEK